MAALPPAAQPATTAELILKGYEKAANEQHRSHLGASLIGQECRRKLWYTFRWADREAFSGKMLRLFQTGHLQEPRLIEDLRRIGVEVLDTDPSTGGQWTVRTLGGHFGCSLDGAALGVPEAPKTWHSLEFKTANAKNFDKLVKDGVAKAKPEHYAQMLVGMELAQLTRCLYLAVNKNTDELYSERIKADPEHAKRLIAKAESIIKSSEPPPRISDDATRFPCKWSNKTTGVSGQCTFYELCHGDQVPEVNCRTCAHSTPRMDGDAGEWLCSNDHLKSMPVLSDALQRTGCGEHRFIPIFLERTAKPVNFVDGVVVYETPDGRVFGNGDGKNGTFSSAEIRRCGAKAALPEMAPLKADYPTAKVIA